MEHIEYEDLGRLIDGNVRKQERKRFFKHLSECKACLTLYNETLTFMGEEKKKKSLLTFPILRKIKALWPAVNTIFTAKRYGLAFAAVLIILFTVPFIVNEFSQPGIKNAKIKYIENRIENSSSPAFFPSGSELYIAVRAGIFVEDFSVLVQTDGKVELQRKINRMLSRQLRQLADEKYSPLQDTHLKKKNFSAMVQRIEELIKKQSLTELFHFGRFIGQSIHATFENQIPKQGDIEKYLRIAQKYKLPPGVHKRLNKLKKNTGCKESRELFKEIEDVFFE